MLHAANGVYVLRCKNTTASPYFIAAWSECQTNGQWLPEAPDKYMATLKPSESRTFTLPKPEHGKARIAVLRNKLSVGQWELLHDDLHAWLGHYPKARQTYLEAP